MTKRNCFYSFHYLPDNWRVATVCNIGAIDGNKPTSDNNWETIKKGGDTAIKEWIANEMSGKSCIVVLVGSDTANRKWINHEIIKGWNDGKGVVGIYINGLKDSNGNTSSKGNNPFDYINYGDTGKKLSTIVKCYNPSGSTSQEKYDWIKQNLAAAVEEAIEIRNNN
ncbi:TIR domain-containing protein [Cronobacter malonaticus]|nr:TIR domain-containing protein [Cronobacter malonaticus]ELY4448998.1 TIR domain-containing protein [Cronobacter malonaticus]ELY6297401.1 TIR domain-containing protein [Cronobacter malonaticus]ELY6317705.1 TIR domain-containing protein [Cronobacter malonaticus]